MRATRLNSPGAIRYHLSHIVISLRSPDGLKVQSATESEFILKYALRVRVLGQIVRIIRIRQRVIALLRIFRELLILTVKTKAQ